MVRFVCAFVKESLCVHYACLLVFACVCMHVGGGSVKENSRGTHE